jgi:hypothetical protein
MTKNDTIQNHYFGHLVVSTRIPEGHPVPAGSDGSTHGLIAESGGKFEVVGHFTNLADAIVAARDRQAKLAPPAPETEKGEMQTLLEQVPTGEVKVEIES